MDIERLAGAAEQIDGAPVLTRGRRGRRREGAARDASTTSRDGSRDAAILLGAACDGRVHLVASVAPALVQRGVKAGAIVKAAAEIVGGGGGGRDTMAQAGGRDPEKLDAAIDAARAAIAAALAS